MSMSTGDLKEILRSLIQEEFEKRDGLKKLVDGQELPSKHVLHCPDCYKDIIESLKGSSEFICEDCGLPLGSGDMAKALKECPSCHGQRARRK